MVRLYNSLSNQLEDFKPLNDGSVGLYTCGPTVYDHVHIGNFRTYIFEDMMRRTLKLNGYSLRHVMNITDVDDKTIERSKKQYPHDEPMEALRKLASSYEKVFMDDAAKLGIDFSNTQLARATEHIKDMQNLIRAIPNRYSADDGVYFNINEYEGYGKLVKLDRSHEHHRIQNDEYDKEHVADFALWKAAKPGEPAWNFEIDDHNLAGHPGWHIECSAMSAKYLGLPFDIHSGGVDLKFPHHENEIAQTKAATGKNLAAYFVHSEHLLVDGKKMSKSLNNFYTLDELAKKKFNPLALRLLVLQSHYRSQLNFTWDSLSAAQNFLNSLYGWADLKHQTDEFASLGVDGSNQLVEKIKESLGNDFNSAMALATLNDVVDKYAPTDELLRQVDDIFGLMLSDRQDINGEQKLLLGERESARENQDWARADKIRQNLVGEGIEIDDTDRGPIWRRVN